MLKDPEIWPPTKKSTAKKSSTGFSYTEFIKAIKIMAKSGFLVYEQGLKP